MATRALRRVLAAIKDQYPSGHDSQSAEGLPAASQRDRASTQSKPALSMSLFGGSLLLLGWTWAMLVYSMIKGVLLATPSLLYSLFCSQTPKLDEQYANLHRYLQEFAYSRTTIQFNYMQLSSHHAIRLLTILPGKASETLSCTLSEVDLGAKPAYTALSYAWAKNDYILYFVFLAIRCTCTVSWTICALLITLLLPTTLLEYCTQLASTFVNWTGLQRMGDALERWTSPDMRSHLILCNGKLLYIRSNLYDFLLQTRKNEDHSQYWIDAICIDQGNLSERSHQVELMTSIYASAERAIAWLGACPPFLNTPEIIRQVHLPDEQCHLTGSDTFADFPHNVMRFIARIRIANIEYFSRTWIIQECTVPKELVFMLGPYRLSSEDMLEVTRLANTGFVARLIHGPFFLNEGSITVLSILQGREDYQRTGSWTLSKYLVAATGHAATDPRDMIYGRLGLVNLAVTPSTKHTVHISDESLQYLLNLRPDYTLTAVDVFTACGVRLLLEIGFSGLSYASDGYVKFLPEGTVLPSWVPHLHDYRAELLDVSNRFKAGGYGKAEVELLSDRYLLLSSGVRYVDTIKSVSDPTESSIAMTILALFEALPEVYAFTRERSITALARTVIADYINDQECDTIDNTDALVQLIRAELLEELEATEVPARGRATIMSQHLPSHLRISSSVHEFNSMMNARSDGKIAKLQARLDLFMSRTARCKQAINTDPERTVANAPNEYGGVLESNGQLDPATAKKVIDSDDERLRAWQTRNLESHLPYRKAMRRRMNHRQFFTTKRGYIGIGSSLLETDDQIMVFAGAGVPYAMHKMRSKDKLRYRMCGEVYMHGIMNGELTLGKNRASLQLVIE